MSLITVKQILAILISVLGSIFAFMNFIRKKDSNGNYIISRGQKRFLGLILLIIVLFVGLSSYLEVVNRDQITADLQISVADPVVINKNGTQKDSFVDGADFLVVSYNTRFVIDATVTLKNVYTLEEYTYHPVCDDGIFSVAEIKSGKYNITVFTSSEEIYKGTIVLNRSNVLNSNGKDIWDFTAFVFGDFESQAKERWIPLSSRQSDIEYPVFTIDTDNCNTMLIFASQIDSTNDGMMQGSFLMLPGQYELNNAVSGSTMKPLVFDIE